MQNLSIPENITRDDFIDYDCSRSLNVQSVVDELSIIEKDLMDTILDLEDAIKYTNHHVMIDNFKVQKERTEKRLNAISYAKGVILGWYKL